MNKFLDKLKNKDLDVLLLLLVLISNASLLVFVNYYDELWNFANSYKMFNGYKIYKELNVIITPLFFYLAQIFFKIFGATILSFRLYNIFIFIVFFMLIYLIFKSLKIVRRRAIIYTLIIFFAFSSMISSGANYNILALIPILVAILLIIKEKQNSFLFGILLFLTFMLKQNIYIYFALGIFIYKFINMKNIKDLFCDLFKIYIISFIGIAIFLIYMYLNNNLYDFINYCFLGISEFGTNHLFIEISGVRFLYIAVVAIIFTFVLIYNKKLNSNIDKEMIKKAKDIFSFGIPLLLICLPIVNYYHATLGSLIVFIEFIYIIDKVLIQNFEQKRKKEKIVYIITIVFYIIYMLYGIIINIIEIRKKEIIFNNDSAFYGSIITIEDYEDIEIICNYIKEQERKDVDVKILSYKANSYMVPLNKNNGIFDLAFLGNLGAGGENELINEIKQLDNTLVLIQTDKEEVFWQESEKARKYIIDNYEKIGEIQEYSIYYIGKVKNNK